MGFSTKSLSPWSLPPAFRSMNLSSPNSTTGPTVHNLALKTWIPKNIEKFTSWSQSFSLMTNCISTFLLGIWRERRSTTPGRKLTHLPFCAFSESLGPRQMLKKKTSTKKSSQLAGCYLKKPWDLLAWKKSEFHILEPPRDSNSQRIGWEKLEWLPPAAWLWPQPRFLRPIEMMGVSKRKGGTPQNGWWK